MNRREAHTFIGSGANGALEALLLNLLLI